MVGTIQEKKEVQKIEVCVTIEVLMSAAQFCFRTKLEKCIFLQPQWNFLIKKMSQICPTAKNY